MRRGDDLQQQFVPGLPAGVETGAAIALLPLAQLRRVIRMIARQAFDDMGRAASRSVPCRRRHRLRTQAAAILGFRSAARSNRGGRQGPRGRRTRTARRPAFRTAGPPLRRDRAHRKASRLNWLTRASEHPSSRINSSNWLRWSIASTVSSSYSRRRVVAQ